MKIRNCSDLTSFLITQAFKTESSYSYKDKLKSVVLRILGAFGSSWAERKLSLLQTEHRVTPFYSKNAEDKAGWLLNEGRPLLNYVVTEYLKKNPLPISPSANEVAQCLANTDKIWTGDFWKTGGFDLDLAIETLFVNFPMPRAVLITDSVEIPVHTMTAHERENWLKGPGGISDLNMILKRYSKEEQPLNIFNANEAARTLAQVDEIWMPKTTELEVEQAIQKGVEALEKNPPSRLDLNAQPEVIKFAPRPNIAVLNQTLAQMQLPELAPTMRHAEQPIPLCPEELVAAEKRKEGFYERETALFKERFGYEPLYVRPSTK